MKNNKKLTRNTQRLLIDKLIQYLATNYALYLKTQNFHWNITGMEFISLHRFFQEQYEELAEAIDVIAEQIRSLGVITPGSFAEFSKLSRIKDAKGKRSAKKMLEDLLADHALIIKLTKELLELAREYQDEVRQDLLVHRLQVHEKFIWMLKSFKQ